ncbi:MAG: single-stranded-DNA-specific exonuclease RecJ [Holosporales bacterium]|jgi:single-stranded-DNA-specific exonuclease|nr:single-stranded-DNA-specific exonuclease RecJ [Holosporales bacterium]
MISVSGKKWLFPQYDEREVLTIQQRYGLSDTMARILSARHVILEEIPTFLDPKIKDLLPDPSLLLGMDAAIDRTIRAIRNKPQPEKITIFGDYDVDGATSVSLLHKYFEQIGVQVDYYIPDRLSEGYGVNPDAIRKIHARETTLIIMVDCGTTSVSEVALANSLGMDSIILDHHNASVELPEAVAVVNPHRVDQPFVPYTQNLCAAGVVFLFLVGLQRSLKNSDFFTFSSLNPQKVPDLMSFCNLVALGTVCDVMPLQGLNRAFVRRGLDMMRKNHGIRALIDVAGIKDKISAGHLGFAVGPRINAAGRIGSSSLGVQLLTTHDELVAKEIAINLNALNEERQRMEKRILEDAIAQIENNKLADNSVILVGDKSWHAGLIGIVASRLKDRYNRPCFVASFEEGGACKGSARSIDGVNIGELIHKAVKASILSSGGGHAMAGGFSLSEETFADFYGFLNKETAEFMKEYQPTLKIDAEMSCPSMDLLHELEKFEPFGVGNPSPKLCFHRVQPVFVKVLNGGHMQCVFKNEAGSTINAVAFRCESTELGRALQCYRRMSIVGTLKEDAIKQGEVRVIMEDVAYT